MSGRSLSLRSQVLLAVLGGAILPLSLVGLWLTSSAVRSGQALLQSHLDGSVARLASAIEDRWEFRNGDIALIAGNEATRRAVNGIGMSAEDSTYLGQLALGLVRTIPAIVLQDAAGRVVWSSAARSDLQSSDGRGASPGGPGGRSEPVVPVVVPIVAAGGLPVGSASVQVALASLLPADSALSGVPGARLAIAELPGGTLLLGAAETAEGPPTGKRQIGDATWLGSQHGVTGTGLRVFMVAPLAPYVDPFGRAARLGVVALVAVSVLALAWMALLTTRATRPLQELVAVSGQVTHGDLDRRVSVRGPAEVRQLGQAFNTMTTHLQDTMDQLARRSALAAVGEFATSLSHDVRNALTSIKVDLERADRRDMADASTRDLVGRALNNVVRLERVVTGALRVARHGHTPPEDLDLREVIRESAATVAGSFAALPAELRLDLPAGPLLVRGDRAALGQLFGNLLFNAVQALRPGGEARVTMELTVHTVIVTITDTGVGMVQDLASSGADEDRPVRRQGTGLGLPIARQIAVAHGGELTLEPGPDGGAVARVRLPFGNDSFRAVEQDMVSPAAAHPGNR